MASAQAVGSVGGAANVVATAAVAGVKLGHKVMEVREKEGLNDNGRKVSAGLGVAGSESERSGGVGVGERGATVRELDERPSVLEREKEAIGRVLAFIMYQLAEQHYAALSHRGRGGSEKKRLEQMATCSKEGSRCPDLNVRESVSNRGEKCECGCAVGDHVSEPLESPA